MRTPRSSTSSIWAAERSSVPIRPPVNRTRRIRAPAPSHDGGAQVVDRDVHERRARDVEPADGCRGHRALGHDRVRGIRHVVHVFDAHLEVLLAGLEPAHDVDQSGEVRWSDAGRMGEFGAAGHTTTLANDFRRPGTLGGQASIRPSPGSPRKNGTLVLIRTERARPVTAAVREGSRRAGCQAGWYRDPHGSSSQEATRRRSCWSDVGLSPPFDKLVRPRR